MRRVCFLSGMYAAEVMETIAAFREAGELADVWIPPGSTSRSALQKRRTDSWCRAVFHMETYAVQMSCSSMAKPVHRPAVAEVVSVERSPARLLGTEEHSRSVSFRCP